MKKIVLLAALFFANSIFSMEKFFLLEETQKIVKVFVDRVILQKIREKHDEKARIEFTKNLKSIMQSQTNLITFLEGLGLLTGGSLDSQDALEEKTKISQLVGSLYAEQRKLSGSQDQFPCWNWPLMNITGDIDCPEIHCLWVNANKKILAECYCLYHDDVSLYLEVQKKLNFVIRSYINSNDLTMTEDDGGDTFLQISNDGEIRKIAKEYTTIVEEYTQALLMDKEDFF